MENNIEIGKRLYDARKSKGYTRAALGKLLDLHESTVKRYEDGDIKALSIDKIKDFSKFLGVSSAYLLGWEDERGTPTEKYKEKKSFVTELLETMVRQEMITDPNNISDDMKKMILDSVRLEVQKILKAGN